MRKNKRKLMRRISKKLSFSSSLMRILMRFMICKSRKLRNLGINCVISTRIFSGTIRTISNSFWKGLSSTLTKSTKIERRPPSAASASSAEVSQNPCTASSTPTSRNSAQTRKSTKNSTSGIINTKRHLSQPYITYKTLIKPQTLHRKAFRTKEKLLQTLASLCIILMSFHCFQQQVIK